ncbi:WD40-repeat-containing domain protein [Jimgerdemannia flammicorona]|uniref:WD40-repeat-containing domain protein n=1 Tax=Jimgerdemannia flammicorona TaxID=994334 RepID=A0A433DLH5_9FUNG|nr:WD40-repeat-containing domain protein [Jimgerdemannia flammicorona]
MFDCQSGFGPPSLFLHAILRFLFSVLSAGRVATSIFLCVANHHILLHSFCHQHSHSSVQGIPKAISLISHPLAHPGLHTVTTWRVHIPNECPHLCHDRDAIQPFPETRTRCEAMAVSIRHSSRLERAQRPGKRKRVRGPYVACLCSFIKIPSFEGHHTDALHKQLHNRERMHTHKRRRPSTSAWTAACTPEILRPTELTLEEYDKVFASIWISHDEVVLGTKCNRLIILNVQTNRRCNIPLVSLPDTLGSSTGAATGMTTKGSLGPNSASALGRSQDDANLGSNCSGIRSLAVNPSRTLLAVGAGNPIQIMVYSLPSFEPYAIFRGHVDCAFAVDWLDDTRLVSGSRDGTLRVWDVTENVVAQHPVLLNATVQVNTSIITRSEIKGRIRDVKLDRTRDEFVTLSTEGYVKLWDTSRVEGMYTCGLRHMQEAVCMARNERAGIYAVGSQGHVSFIDPRAGVRGIVHEVASVDDGWGVRSLSFDNHMVTAGGGLGRVSFYDLRAQQYLMVDAKSGANYIQASGGWLCQDANYQTYFVGQPIQNAIYTLTYDDDRTRLFAAGGPLQAGLTGSYAALM